MRFVLIACLVFSILAVNSETPDTLELVHVFFRHGSRNPERKDTYPKDVYKEDSFLPDGYGQLTNGGKQRAYKLGEILRNKYNEFLGPVYTTDLVAMNATDFDRTKMSALLVLGGLFKPSKSQFWSTEHLMWLPAPYSYEKDRYDYTLRRPNRYCPAYLKELEEVLASEEVASKIEAHQEAFDYIRNHTGLEMKTLGNMFSIYQTLKAEETLNFTLPEWTKSVWPEPITSLAVQQCYYENSNDLLKRLNGGRMLSRVLSNIQAKIQGKLSPASRKMFLYSGHENNVINVLSAMDLFEPHFPLYSAAVAIELHRLPDSQDRGVKVFYLRDVDASEPFQVLTLNNCTELCPLDRFKEITKSHVPVNYTQECHSNVNLD